MKNSYRITFSLTEEISKIVNQAKADLKISKSKIINKALKFYCDYKDILEKVDIKKLKIYVDLLSAGEYVILDIEHFFLFLKLVEKNEDFWDKHK